jgi:hypothetical protein
LSRYAVMEAMGQAPTMTLFVNSPESRCLERGLWLQTLNLVARRKFGMVPEEREEHNLGMGKLIKINCSKSLVDISYDEKRLHRNFAFGLSLKNFGLVLIKSYYFLKIRST